MNVFIFLIALLSLVVIGLMIANLAGPQYFRDIDGGGTYISADGDVLTYDFEIRREVFFYKNRTRGFHWRNSERRDLDSKLISAHSFTQEDFSSVGCAWEYYLFFIPYIVSIVSFVCAVAVLITAVLVFWFKRVPKWLLSIFAGLMFATTLIPFGFSVWDYTTQLCTQKVFGGDARGGGNSTDPSDPISSGGGNTSTTTSLGVYSITAAGGGGGGAYAHLSTAATLPRITPAAADSDNNNTSMNAPRPTTAAAGAGSGSNGGGGGPPGWGDLGADNSTNYPNGLPSFSGQGYNYGYGFVCLTLAWIVSLAVFVLSVLNCCLFARTTERTEKGNCCFGWDDEYIDDDTTDDDDYEGNVDEMGSHKKRAAAGDVAMFYGEDSESDGEGGGCCGCFCCCRSGGGGRGVRGAKKKADDSSKGQNGPDAFTNAVAFGGTLSPSGLSPAASSLGGGGLASGSVSVSMASSAPFAADGDDVPPPTSFAASAVAAPAGGGGGGSAAEDKAERRRRRRQQRRADGCLSSAASALLCCCPSLELDIGLRSEMRARDAADRKKWKRHSRARRGERVDIHEASMAAVAVVAAAAGGGKGGGGGRVLDADADEEGYGLSVHSHSRQSLPPPQSSQPNTTFTSFADGEAVGPMALGSAHTHPPPSHSPPPPPPQSYVCPIGRGTAQVDAMRSVWEAEGEAAGGHHRHYHQAEAAAVAASFNVLPPVSNAVAFGNGPHQFGHSAASADVVAVSNEEGLAFSPPPRRWAEAHSGGAHALARYQHNQSAAARSYRRARQQQQRCDRQRRTTPQRQQQQQ